MRSVLLLAILVPIGAAAGQDAAVFRGGVAHTGVYAPAGSSLVGLQWVFRTDGDLIASPTVADGVVYLASGDGGLYALDLLSGAERWRRELGAPSHSTPAVAGGLVYAVTRDGRIQAIDRATGRRTWEVATGPDAPLVWGHESGDIYTSSPAVARGLVIVGAGDGHVYALDAATGAERWRFRTGGRVRSSPAIADARVYVGSMDGVLYALDVATGAPLWRFETTGAGLFSGDFGFDRRTIQSSPAVADGAVFVGSRDGTMYAVDAATGRRRFTVSHGTSWVITSPAVTGGTVFLGSSDAAFAQAVDAATGEERWRAETPGIVWSSPAVAGGQVIVGVGSGVLLGLDRATGSERWRFRTQGGLRASPVVTDGGFVLIGDTDGVLYALRTGDGPPVRRVVFYDSAYARAAWNGDAEFWTRVFVNRGYERLAERALAEFLAARTADGAPSVVVFALDHLPRKLAGEGGPDAPLRRYLEAGGKVVWPGVPPLLWPRDPATGRRRGYGDVAWSALEPLLGVSHEEAIFDTRGVRLTPAGRRWGLRPGGRLAWGVAPAEVSEVLAYDEWGLAAAWVRSYGGPPGSGFVRMGDRDPEAAYFAAEYRPARAVTGR